MKAETSEISVIALADISRDCEENSMIVIQHRCVESLFRLLIKLSEFVSPDGREG